MTTNILEYIISDVYYQLWMVASSSSGSQDRAFHKADWHPALVSQFDNPDDVPDMIEVKEGNVHHVNGEGNFHLGRNAPSVYIPEITIVWTNDKDEFDRKVGPSKITLTEVKKWHNNGVLHRRRGDAVICKQASFTWGKKGEFRRNNGPYHVSIRKPAANSNDGFVSDWKMDGIVPSWNTENGRRLSQLQIKEVVAGNDLEINLLANDSVFLDIEEEFIFLTEIAE